jgi:hypothetical protein
MTTVAMIAVALIVWPLAAYGLGVALRAAWRGVADWWWRRSFTAIKDRRLGVVERHIR